MIKLILSFILFFIIASSFINTKVHICLFLLYVLFIPYTDLSLFGVRLGSNTVILLILMGFLFKNWRNIRYFDFSIFKPFLLLYLFYLIMIPFQKGLPVAIMMEYFLREIILYFIFPIIIWNASRLDPSISRLLQRTFLLSIALISFYGICLTLTPGENPYLERILPILGMEFSEEYALSGVGRVFGKISSVFSHPTYYGLYLSLVLIYLLVNKYKIRKSFFYLILTIVILNILFCGVRTSIIAAAIGLVFFLYKVRQLKMLLGVLIVLLGVYLVLINVQGMSQYIGSLTDIKSQQSQIGGSSIEMRLEQLQGAYQEVQNCKLIGKGFNWDSDYTVSNGPHPTIKGFESVIFSVLCNNGLLGIAIWLLFCVYMLFLKKWPNKELQTIMPVLFAIYLVYIIVTGEFNYLKLFLLIYTLINIDLWCVYQVPKKSFLRENNG